MPERSARSASATSPWQTSSGCFRPRGSLPSSTRSNCTRIGSSPDLLPFLARHGIVAEAWYPLGHGSAKLLGEPAIVAAAKANGRSAVQVILRWHVQRGFVAIPKSTDPAHIAANIEVFDFELTGAQMAAIDALGTVHRTFRVPRWLMAATMPRMRPHPLP